MPTIPVTYNKFQGLRNVGKAQKDGKGFFRVALNVDLDNDHVVRRRAGSDLIYPGSPASLLTDGADLLFREGTELLRLEGDFSTTTLRADFSSSLRPVASCLVNGVLYYSDGEVTGVYQAGQSRSWGLDLPLVPTVVASVGTLLPGAYLVSLTFQRGDGQESGATKPVRVDVTGGGFQVSISPSSDPDVTGICVYVSSVDGEILWRQGVMPNAAATFTVSGGLLASGLKLATANKRAPFPGDLICFYAGRMYVASGSTIRCTDPWNYELMTMDQNSLPFEHDVRMMLPVGDGIWVGTEKEFMFLSGKDPQADGGFQIRSRNTCSVIKRASAIVEGTALSVRGLPPGPVAIWLSKDGVFLGDSAGNAMNMTGDNFVPPDGEEGWACLVKEEGMDRVFFGMKSGAGYGSAAVVVTIT